MEEKTLTELSKILDRKLFASFPEWEKYAEFDDAEYDVNQKSLGLKIPSPATDRHFLLILERGDCIEVSFHDGNLGMIAERQMMCGQNNDNFCVEAAIEFLEEIVSEKVLIAKNHSSWLSRLIESKSLSFIKPAEIEEKKFARIYSWQGNFNSSIS
ncbi:MAG TPA: hypothetical protein VF721_17205 [Pyrinomonadaceae bacterium]|jgi:hypothetical protein